jgi:hypothetical protein
MSKPFELLNKVQEFVIKFANENSVNLHDEFGTEDKFKEFIVGLSIKTLVDCGLSVEAALDLVLGEGTYAKIAEECWNTIEAKSVTVA